MLRGRVLLLNSDFSVLGTIGVARAIRMQLRDENPIQVLEIVPDRVLRSGGGDSYQVPSVICLRHYVNVRKKREESGAKRMKIYLRDKYQCQYCSIKAGKKHPTLGRILEVKDLTLDHITPKSRGGTGLPSNLVTACKPCNQRKADRNPEEAGMPLRTQIHDITQVGVDNIMLCKYVEHRPEWLPYLEAKEGFLDAYEHYKDMVA
jgi:5-methylcytosine-specific restriction endonuclease McrA